MNRQTPELFYLGIFFWVRGLKFWFEGHIFSQGYSVYFFLIFAHLRLQVK